MKLDTIIENTQIISFDKRITLALFIKNPELRNSKINALKNVNLSDSNLSVLPASFISCSGEFDISGNNFTTLFGCPETVKGKFNCSGNPRLTNLLGGPKSCNGFSAMYLDSLISLEGIAQVPGDVYISNCNNLKSTKGLPDSLKGTLYLRNNGLTSLEGCPKKVVGTVQVTDNKLTSLVGGPEEITLNYYCNNNLLATLEGAPKKLKNGDFNCHNNKLTSFEHAPIMIKGEFNGGYNSVTSLIGIPKEVISLRVDDNKITSLLGIHKMSKFENIKLSSNPIVEGGLGLLLVPGLLSIQAFDCGKFTEAAKIISKYLSKGKSAILECQDELIEAGFEEFAKL